MDSGKLRACEHPGEENHKARERESGLAPWWPSAPRVVRDLLGRLRRWLA